MAKIRNLDKIRAIPEIGKYLYEALSDLHQNSSNIAQQVNGNPDGQPAKPPTINGLKVTGNNGHFSIAIEDNNPVFRGIGYTVEHADNPQFNQAVPVHVGASRNATIYLGNVGRYWRAFSAYPFSGPSAPVHHGDELQPVMVHGGGGLGAPTFQPSQGSGTGGANVAGQGPGTLPFRPVNGAPATK